MADETHIAMEKIDSAIEKEFELRLTSLGRMRYNYREYIAEFWGTFIFILFGDGVIAQTVLSGGAHGNQVTINFCWGIAVIIGIYVSGGVSGGHLNPAVTLTLGIFRRFPLRKMLYYWIAQGAGAFLAAAILYANYYQAFNHLDGGIRVVDTDGLMLKNTTANIFATYPAPFLSLTGAFFDEFLGTAVLMFGIFAINDMGNAGAGNLGPLMVGLLVVAIGMAFGWQTGYALNPARDLGPRLFSYFIYGNGVFTGGNSFIQTYTWVPIVAPLIGGPVGGLLYDFFIFNGQGPLQDLFQRP